MSAPRRCNLTLNIAASTGREHVPFLRRKLVAAHRILRPTLRELSLALVGDKRMSLLHGQFLHRRGPTDVLSFPLESLPGGRITSGEVVVCVPQAVRQAHIRRINARDELLLYALHGMLHLCGFDDRTESAFRIMHRKEDEILCQLGVGSVYQTGALPARPKLDRSR